MADVLSLGHASLLSKTSSLSPLHLHQVVTRIQAYFISQDTEMYCSPRDTPCIPKTWNISHDLGQIEYVFSCKTGTLTQNVSDPRNALFIESRTARASRRHPVGPRHARARPKTLDPHKFNAKLAKLKQQKTDVMERVLKSCFIQLGKPTLVSSYRRSLLRTSQTCASNMSPCLLVLALRHSRIADKPEPQTRSVLD